MFEGLRKCFVRYKARRYVRRSPNAAAEALELWSDSGERLRKRHRLLPLTIDEAIAIRAELDRMKND
jgi:hypothetical protein